MNVNALLIAREVGYSYPSSPLVPVVERVSLALASGDRLGVVGENGVGKSTLLRLLAGELTPTQGEVVGSGSIAVVHQELGVDVGSGSVGERYRERLVRALATEAEVLLLDEPTNHLDLPALRHLTGRLRDYPGGVVVVTHDRELLDAVATGVLDLDPTMDGVPARYRARRGRPFAYADYRHGKDAALARWRARYRREQERLAQLFDQRDYAYEHLSDEWRPPKGSQRHRRGTRARQHVKAADRAHERLERDGVDVPPPPPELALPPLPPPGSAPGERRLIVGPNGSGKSTLLRKVRDGVAPGVRVGYLPQEPEFTGQTRQAAQEIATARVLAALEDGGLEPDLVVPLTATGLVADQDLERPVSELSVGRRRRLDLAMALMTAPQVLLLDEPTNHLSVDLMDALTQWLREVDAQVVVATHDRRMRADLEGAGWSVQDLGPPGVNHE